MNRTLTYFITKADTPLTVKGFLKRQGFSSRNLIDLKKLPDSIRLNGQNAYMNAKISPGDELTVSICEEESSEKIVPVELPLDIIYEDEDLMVINKPAGMPIHPSMNHYDNSLANALAWYFAKQNKPFIFRCVNRLDKDTSGLTIIAKHMVSAGILSTMVAAKGTDTPPSGTQCPPPILREYLAIVRGKVNPEAGTINAPIARKEGSVLERTVDFVQGENAITHYRTVSNKNGYSLLSITLETGRTHQIRVHMKYLGYPLIGDYLYNPDTELISRQALHSHRLSFVHPITHKPMDFTAPLPPDMQFVL